MRAHAGTSPQKMRLVRSCEMEAADARVRMNLFLDKLVQFPAALYASAGLQFKYMCLLLVLMYCTLVS